MPATDDAILAERFEGCLATAARLIDRAVASAFDDRLRPLGLRSTQVSLLAGIAAAHAPDCEAAPAAADLTRAMRMDQTTLSRTLARLEERGLIERTHCSQDARVSRLALTAAGRKALRDAAPLWDEAQAEVSERLGPRGSDALRHAAARLGDT